MKLVPKPLLAQVIMASFDDVEKGGRRGCRGDRRRHHPGRHGDDGQAGDGGGRAVRQGGLRPRRRGDPAGRIRRHARGGRRGDRAHRARAAREAARRASRCRTPRPSGCASGRAARRRFPRSGRISPDYYCMDGTIPRKRLGEVLKAIAAMEKKYGLRCANVFHAGDGNLHPLIMFDANDPDSVRARRGIRLRDPRGMRRGRRHGHRRARRRRREDPPDVRAVRPRPRWTRSSR